MARKRSSPSLPIKTVFLDVDDVLYDCLHYLNKVLREVHKVQIPIDYQPKYYDFREVVADFGAVFSGLPSNWPELLPVHSFAKFFAEMIKANGNRIILLTSINPRLGPSRIRALHRDSFPYDELHFTEGASKAEFVEALRPKYSGPILFVDDLLKSCNEVVAKFPDVATFCYWRPHNELVEKHPLVRVSNSRIAMYGEVQNFLLRKGNEDEA